MIITQTPLRISFAGGGTDFADFYEAEGGCVLSTAIDKYIYVIIKERFDDKIRIGYSRTEMVNSIEEIEHELVRECLRLTGIESGVEISTMADIPSEGSGLGSSSSVTVGLLNAMYAYKGDPQPPRVLAEQACKIEIDVLGKPIGKQDQYIAAFGNMRLIEFLQSGEVNVTTVDIDPERKLRMNENLMLFYTGVTRRASDILAEQKQNIPARLATLREMKLQAYDLYHALSNNSVDRLGEILHQGWLRKKQLAGKISSDGIDRMYEEAVSAGALGGKIAGAGGGGFMLLYCHPEKQPAVRERLRSLGMRELPFRFERDGTKVILNIRR